MPVAVVMVTAMRKIHHKIKVRDGFFLAIFIILIRSGYKGPASLQGARKGSPLLGTEAASYRVGAGLAPALGRRGNFQFYNCKANNPWSPSEAW